MRLTETQRKRKQPATARRRHLDSGSKVRTKQLNRIYERDKGICQLCHQPCKRQDASREHKKDLSLCTREEARDINNMVLAHKTCNNRRHWKPSSKMRTYRDSPSKHMSIKVGDLFPNLIDVATESD